MAKVTQSFSSLDARISEPLSWIEFGESLFQAGECLIDRVDQVHRSQVPRAEVRVLMLGIVRGYMTLVGIGLENHLKALALARGDLTTDGEHVAFARSFKGAKNHDLKQMALSLGVEISADEGELLERATLFVKWAGRYPVALRKQSSQRAFEDTRVRMKRADHKMSLAIAARLKSLVQAT